MKRIFLILGMFSANLKADPLKCLAGYSEAKSPIYGFFYGDTALNTNAPCASLAPGFYLITGQIHGNERSTGALLQGLISNKAPFLSSKNGLLIIPVVNVDGATENERTNRLKVDLNRNFPSREVMPQTRILQTEEYPGEKGYIASETAMVAGLIRRSSAYIDLHGYKKSIYVPEVAYRLKTHTEISQQNKSFQKAMSASLILKEKIAEIFGLRYDLVDGSIEGDVGSSDEYAATQGIPAACLEMPEIHRNLYKNKIKNDILYSYAVLFKSWFNEVEASGRNQTLTHHQVDEKKRTH